MMDNLQTDNAALAAALRYHMEARGMSLSGLAAKAHISKSTLSKILSGSTSPYVHTLYQICDALEVRLADVLFSQEDMMADAKRFGLSEEELAGILFVRGLSDEKRRWLNESLKLLASYREDSFSE